MKLTEIAKTGARVEYDNYNMWKKDLPAKSTFHKDGTLERAQSLGKELEGVSGTWDSSKNTGWIYEYYLNKKNLREDVEVVTEATSKKLGFFPSRQDDLHWAIGYVHPTKDGHKLITTSAGWAGAHTLAKWKYDASGGMGMPVKVSDKEAEKILADAGFPSPKIIIAFYKKWTIKFGLALRAMEMGQLADELSEANPEFEYSFEQKGNEFILKSKKLRKKT